jgi:DNA-binding CsgD family transcriptional regulator
MIDLLDQFIEAVSGAILPIQAGEHFADLAERLGFPESVVIAPLEPDPSLPVACWRTTGNIEDYARNHAPAQDPLAQYAFAVDTPFDVPTASAALGYRESDIRRVAYEAVRDKHIVVLPVHRRSAFVMYAACAGDKPDDTPHTRALLHTAAHVTYDVMTALVPNRELTLREAECLMLIAGGNSYRATGQKLGIAERTVRAVVASVKTKLRANTQSEVIAKAMAAGNLRVPMARSNAG